MWLNASQTLSKRFRYGSVTVTLHLRYRRRAQRHPATPGPRQFPAVATRPRAPGTASVQSAKFSAHCRVAPAGGRARHSAEFFAQCPRGRAPGRSRHRAGVTGSVTRYRISNRYRIGNPAWPCCQRPKNLWPSCAEHQWQAVGVFTADGWSRYLLSKSSSADLFPGTGENPSQVFSSTGNNQPLRRRGLLKSEDTPCPKSGLPRAHDMPGSMACSASGRRGLNI